MARSTEIRFRDIAAKRFVWSSYTQNQMCRTSWQLSDYNEIFIEIAVNLLIFSRFVRPLLDFGIGRRSRNFLGLDVHR